MFSFFKKKPEEHVELTLHNLTVGATLEYDMKTWVVKEIYHYLWENNFKSKEYKLSDGNTYLFLEIDDNDDVLISKPYNVKKVAPNFKQEVITLETVPENLVYNSEIYRLGEESFGSYQKEGTEGWSELTAWMYWNDKNGFICIERWSKFEFEAHVGTKINPFEIDNLLPGTQN